jgi:hypothetical protein
LPPLAGGGPHSALAGARYAEALAELEASCRREAALANALQGSGALPFGLMVRAALASHPWWLDTWALTAQFTSA